MKFRLLRFQSRSITIFRPDRDRLQKYAEMVVNDEKEKDDSDDKIRLQQEAQQAQLLKQQEEAHRQRLLREEEERQRLELAMREEAIREEKEEKRRQDQLRKEQLLLEQQRQGITGNFQT